MAKEQGLMFFHCRKCVEEWKNDAPGTEGLSPREYARQQGAATARGVQIFCTRHELNIAHFDFMDEQPLIDGSAEGDFSDPSQVQVFDGPPGEHECEVCSSGAEHTTKH